MKREILEPVRAEPELEENKLEGLCKSGGSKGKASPGGIRKLEKSFKLCQFLMMHRRSFPSI